MPVVDSAVAVPRTLRHPRVTWWGGGTEGAQLPDAREAEEKGRRVTLKAGCLSLPTTTNQETGYASIRVIAALIRLEWPRKEGCSGGGRLTDWLVVLSAVQVLLRFCDARV